MILPRWSSKDLGEAVSKICLGLSSFTVFFDEAVSNMLFKDLLAPLFAHDLFVLYVYMFAYE